MAHVVTEQELAAKVAEAKLGVQGARIDTTGLKVDVPLGFDLCVFEAQAEDYRRANHHVEPYTVEVNGEKHHVAFIRYGEPESIVDAILNRVFYPKPGEVQEA